MSLTTEQIERESQELILHVARGLNSSYEGTWTLSVYDTAWVSMIKHPNGHWLFPECFQYVLQQQQPDGSWPKYASEIDGILNTLASLLAIEKRLAKDTTGPDSATQGLQQRKIRGLSALQAALDIWDVDTCVHVGFEVLVPALISMLAEHGVEIHFPGEAALASIHKEKMRKFSPEILYGPHQTTLLHSLEAFGRTIDCSRLAHHKVGGSMLGSLSATAAYLIWSSEWDSEAEDYLRCCVERGGGGGCGGVPSAYPCEVFEFSWVLTTLMHAGLPKSMFSREDVMAALMKVASLMEGNKGKIGFASGMLSDADDTAKSIQLLNNMGITTDADTMISHFMSPKGHMMTYVGERDLSISANCNALSCILSSPDVGKHQSSVQVIAGALCDAWWKGEVRDKWNLSDGYTSMLLAQTMVLLLRQWDAGHLPLLPVTLVRDRVVVVLLQLLNRILFRSCSRRKTTAASGSETVAYEILACSALRSLPLRQSITSKLDEIIADGKEYLSNSRSKWEDDQYIWVEKVTYGSRTLSKAYCLAALYTTSPQTAWGESTEKLFDPLSSHTTKLSKFFQAILMPDEDPWNCEASVVEGLAFTHRLRSARTQIFPQRTGLKDTYLTYIPIAWTLINNTQGLDLPANLLWDMMNFSLLDFLVDEYMESTVARLDQSSRKHVKEFIHTELFAALTQPSISRKRPLTPDTDTESGMHPSSPTIDSIKSVLAKYVKEVTLHPSVVAASPSDRLQVRRELHVFLMAHMIQMEDNEKLVSSSGSAEATEAPTVLASPRSSFFTWARTTASQHISCPISFVFYNCLLSASTSGKQTMDCFTTPQQKYIASDLCAHLAVMSRLFNDYASTSRDQREGNLNSVNFPEFHAGGVSKEGADFSSMRKALLQLGEYERSASKVAMSRLLQELGSQTEGRSATKVEFVCRGIRLFTGVTELFADMYVAKDLTNATR